MTQGSHTVCFRSRFWQSRPWQAASSAKPQARKRSEGKFTIPYEARLGKAILPPGDYTISVDISGDALVREEKSQKPVVHLFFQDREDPGQGRDALLIGGQGQQRIVHSRRVAELGTTFVCYPTLAHPQRYREEVRQMVSVPVLQAKN